MTTLTFATAAAGDSPNDGKEGNTYDAEDSIFSFLSTPTFFKTIRSTPLYTCFLEWIKIAKNMSSNQIFSAEVVTHVPAGANTIKIEYDRPEHNMSTDEIRDLVLHCHTSYYFKA